MYIAPVAATVITTVITTVAMSAASSSSTAAAAEDKAEAAQAKSAPTPSQRVKEWEDTSGFSNRALIGEIYKWCAAKYACAFVLFDHGTVVFVTEAMAKAAAASLTAPLTLPGYPPHRIRKEGREKFALDRVNYVEHKLATLTGQPLILYRAAVSYMAKVGYPVPGTTYSDSLVRLHEGSMWSMQLRHHNRAISHMPKGTHTQTAQEAIGAIKESGFRTDLMTLVPAGIHAPTDVYDTANRALDQKIWDNMHQSGLYDNPETTGLRTFSATPNAAITLSGMFR